jgi:hypothetical protein
MSNSILFGQENSGKTGQACQQPVEHEIYSYLVYLAENYSAGKVSEAGHNSREQAYQDTVLYEWFLKQKK